VALLKLERLKMFGTEIRELSQSQSPLYAALIILPYAGLLIGLDVAGQYGEVTGALLPMQFNLASNSGFGEWFEYSLTFTVALMLILLWVRDRDWTYLTNAALFLWLVLDNSFEIHELSGQWLGPSLDIFPSIPIEPHDIGEAALFFVVGVIWLSGLAVSLKHARHRQTVYSLLLAGCVIGAAVFGVIVDMIVVWGPYTPIQLEIVTFIEDGGEFLMICLSFIVAVAIYDTERKRLAALEHSPSPSTET
jgi:hypothetical protein